VTKEQGFTLVELVMVMVLVGILAAVITPRINIGTFQERGFRDEFAAAMRFAQKSAIAANCPIAVTLVDNTSYAANYTATCTGGPLAVPGFDGALSGAPPSGVTFTSTQGTITFDGAGRADVSATVTIGSGTVQIHAGTGYVEEL